MSKFKKVLLSGASALAICIGANATASAGDHWNGPYFGAHLGYGWAETDGRFKSTQTSLVNHGNSDGLIYGFHAGINKQMGQYVIGIEADVSGADIDEDSVETGTDGTGQIVSSVDTLASVRGRLGFLFDNTLVYGTAGIAYIDSEFDVHDSDESGIFNLDGIGGVIGAGAEMAVSENVSVGLEGLYYIFDESERDFSNKGPLTSSGDTADFVSLDNMFVVRLRGTYHLN